MTKYPKITAIFDYVVEITGAYDYYQNQLFKIEAKQPGQQDLHLILISASENKAYCLTDGGIGEFLVGSEVKPLDATEEIKTSTSYFGKIIDINGKVLFPLHQPSVLNFLPQKSYAFNKPNTLLEYQPLKEQLTTGYISIDLLVPIGKGQRELIIGDRKTGKTHIALNTIINQKGKNVKCIYVAIGQQHSQVSNVYETLKQNDALDYTMIVNASSSKPFDQFLAPYVAMAHAENLCHTDDVLIVFDDLSAHANIYREVALLTNKPVGKEAFPGDMFFAHARLLERSGKFVGRKSITALPILQTIENDITSLVSSNVISITDGQIVTNSDLFASGKLPAVDIDLSVSRISREIQKPYIAKVGSEIAKIYKAYKRQMRLTSLKYDLNDATNKLITEGMIVENMFIQKGISVYTENAMFLTSKLIAWGILKGIDNIALALRYIDVLVAHNQNAKDTFQRLIEQTQADDNLAKQFFAFALDQYAKYSNLDWKIAYEGQFLPFDQAQLQNLDYLVKGEK
ncbi:MSC_0619 family F1-like ATPase alpha subunit [Mycoplasma nasistruthionis]|uniref:ATP F0F1 synthase subunit alpha n=1 Tax=Mycoplasma nasistruthionis TaxID=353852 RepID=A0A5B7XV32_9MOLU|nr:ATP F0F1 synthase subunit alpha [Mycoplasma nasistruthionis]QCZ36729.1 ATP F0F1 synthase subunit alpha [Mycoplasma nasistruthionis]QCZ36740.1 ATP F0F1 synthase subunit alpha [Mycoplasma nasistruthionis]